jgi:hypothetical protein
LSDLYKEKQRQRERERARERERERERKGEENKKGFWCVGAFRIGKCENLGTEY